MRTITPLHLVPFVVFSTSACIFVWDGKGSARQRVERAELGAATAPSARISSSALLAHVQVLSSDEFEGRLPGTKGEDRSVDYLVRQAKQIGLEPGHPDGTFVQQVPLVGFRTQAVGSFRTKDRELALDLGKDAVALTRWQDVEAVVDAAPIVFVGYGVVAPEYGWDDYKGLDVKGKTVVMLINDPPVADAKDPSKLDVKVFGGKAMTYYGRWTYKYAIAAEKGAAACLIVHQTEPAAYPWSVVLSSWNKENFDLRSETKGHERAKIEAWITLEKAQELFTACGQDFRALEARAATREFHPVELGATASFRARNTTREVLSRNVVAKLTGSDPARTDEYVVYSAHWDHLGKDEKLQGDQVKNGAVDNATGCAGLLGIAEAFASGPRPPRSVLFLWVTAEEQGLLGSRWYAEHPLYPLEKTLANVNMDSLNTWGRTRDIVCVGVGQSTLDEVLTDCARAQGRSVKPDPSPEKGAYYRSDHFEFAKVGVPSLYADGGEDVIGRPEGWGHQKAEDFTAKDYHQVSDEVKLDWDLSGAAQDMELLLAVGARVAHDATWPAWKPASEFRARRESMLAQRP
ncbi:MAG: M28 family peptidase [Planctomycetes bacterium]|nr:M28 family peptidase [Planctomycetota bacterium]